MADANLKAELERITAKSQEVDEELRVCQRELNQFRVDGKWRELVGRAFLDDDLDGRLRLWRERQDLIARIEMAKAAQLWFEQESVILKRKLKTGSETL